MTKVEKDLIDVANEGQPDDRNTGKFVGEAFTRAFAGKVKNVAKLRNPLNIHLLIYEIERIIEIINPALLPEIDWLNKVTSNLKLLHNEIVIANRLLGIKDDNQYDTRVFEKAVRERFFLGGIEIKPDTPIKTDFKTMVELVEIGARRFSN